MIREELAYTRSREDPNQGVLVRAAKALGLDVVAFDYARTQSGELVVFEPNPFATLWASFNADASLRLPAALRRAALRDAHRLLARARGAAARRRGRAPRARLGRLRLSACRPARRARPRARGGLLRDLCPGTTSRVRRLRRLHHDRAQRRARRALAARRVARRRHAAPCELDPADHALARVRSLAARRLGARAPARQRRAARAGGVLLFLALDAHDGRAPGAAPSWRRSSPCIRCTSSRWPGSPSARTCSRASSSMLTLLAYAGYARAPGVARYAARVLACALALLAKPMPVTLPFVLLLLDFWPLRRLAPAARGSRSCRSSRWRSRSRSSRPRGRSRARRARPEARLPLGARVANAIDALRRYLRQSRLAERARRLLSVSGGAAPSARGARRARGCSRVAPPRSCAARAPVPICSSAGSGSWACSCR